jgi:colanic acid/amylovoran biosynthesis protein
MNFILLGVSLNSGNRGVNALTRGTITWILNNFENPKISLISYSVSEKKEHEIQFNSKKYIIEEIPSGSLKKGLIAGILSFVIKKESILGKYNKNCKLIKESDFVLDISEGDSFSDIYGWERFLLHSFIKLLTINIGKKLVFLPQTIGPFKRKWVKVCAGWLMRNAHYVFVRDMLSYDIAKKDGNVKEERLSFIPDMAFYMQPNGEGVKEKIEKKEQNEKIIGLNISGLLYNGGYTQNNMFNLKSDYKEMILRLMNKLLEDKNNKIMLVPHVLTKENDVEDDLTAIKNIYKQIDKKYQDRIIAVESIYREDQYKYLISKCDFFMGSRMHACIAAISTLVPTVPLAYSRKFVGVWNNFGLGDNVADLTLDSEEEVNKKIVINFNKKEEIKLILEEKIKNIKDDIDKIKNKIME